MIRLTSLDGWREATFEGPPMRYRFHLGQRLTESNQRSLLVIGLNPSTATHLATDPTVRKLEKLARAMGLDRLDMTNLDPFRSTDPQGLIAHRAEAYQDVVVAKVRRDAFSANESIIQWLACRAELVLCAWGKQSSPKALATHVEQLASGIVSVLGRSGVKLHCLATTEDGTPRHPLYLKDELRPVPWEPRA
jgi:hypothetical protein